ncbi:NAD(P)-dependent oxidoreductase [Sneathiella sp.]|uniref:NAD(P)-dependent oxidoreductase n=1 Tax=Sneathiella sp. TaxID=1964365 RepID=UPI0026140359|nr:NAD(P)-dependent oxidoreductase [Sneathiella sp.]MDF2368794.1 NAD(P)-dependent oxidoreductase [Sneathiella sp.]
MVRQPVIGVAGCGEMGLPMARNLQQSGFEVYGYDVRPAGEFGDFSTRMLENAEALAARCPVIISVVRDWAQTEELCFGPDGLFSGEGHPETLIISSTLSPKMISNLRNIIPAGTQLIDAPMSGAPFRAEDGTLTFMLGGEPDVISVAMPAFQAMGSEINHLGPLGQGMMCKVLNNMLAASSVVAVREILNAADALGFPRDRLLEVASSSSGGTWFGDNLDKISWAKEGYSLINTIGILEKDVNALIDTTADFPELRINEFARSVIAELRNLPEE